MARIFSFRGEIGRGAYALWGLGLFGAKMTIDRYAVTENFKRQWMPWNYLSPPEWFVSELHEGHFRPLLLLLVLALPFVWAGLALTTQRLRALGLPQHLVLLFFLPFVNLLFFATLSILPDREHSEWVRTRSGGGFVAQIIPRSKWGSAAFGILTTAAIGLVLAALLVGVMASYGWGLFVGIPFLMGLLSAYFYSFHEPRTGLESVSVGASSVVLLGFVFLLFAFEGIVCIVMAAPIGVLLASLGGYLGYVLQSDSRRAPEAFAFTLPLVLALLISGEAFVPKSPEVFTSVTSIDIAAPPEVVWNHVVSFSEIPPPEHWLFKTGVAYPIRARIDGRGPGAIRRCEFSTGAFVEPIEIWDEPRLLAFSVTSNPPPLAEWSPLREIHPPHLNNFFLSERGQFRLTALPGGGTRLEGTTWYRHYIWPSVYWRVYSDFIIHRIHLRVLEHIRGLAEG